MASDFYDLRPEQVPNAVTQSFPNVHFLAKSSTVGLGSSEMKREAGGQGEFSVGKIFGAATPPRGAAGFLAQPRPPGR